MNGQIIVRAHSIGEIFMKKITAIHKIESETNKLGLCGRTYHLPWTLFILILVVFILILDYFSCSPSWCTVSMTKNREECVKELNVHRRNLLFSFSNKNIDLKILIAINLLD